MRVTLLGHASILVEMEGGTCLMDPVFFDPFEEGSVVSCPKRRIYPDKLPRVDILIVSHRHPDHFDLQSLALVSRDVDAIVPADPLIVYALRKLGFERIHPVHAMVPILSHTFELYPTQSALRSVREFGMVFKDSSGTMWNQVDSVLTADTIERVRERFGRTDLMLAMYASQNFEYFDNRSTEFPYEAHRQNLENVIRIEPRWVVPASAGFRFCGDRAWLNAFLFPISRERFVADLRSLAFPGGVHIMDPGDIVEIERAECVCLRGASEAAVLEADDTARIRFDPTASVPALVDPNPGGCCREGLEKTIRAFMEGMSSYARSGYQLGEKVITLYCEHAVRYALSIVYPEGAPEWYHFEFNQHGVKTSVSSEGGPADLVNRIAASALAGWITHEKSFFYVRAYSRRYDSMYEVTTTEGGVRLERRVLPDLLMHYLLNAAPESELAAKHYVNRQIEALPSTMKGAA